MSEEEVKKVVFDLLKKIAPDTMPEDLQPAENIRQALDIDSFDFLQFVVALSEKLELTLPEQDYGKIASLKDLLDYVRTNKKS